MNEWEIKRNADGTFTIELFKPGIPNRGDRQSISNIMKDEMKELYDGIGQAIYSSH